MREGVGRRTREKSGTEGVEIVGMGERGKGREKGREDRDIKWRRVGEV